MRWEDLDRSFGFLVHDIARLQRKLFDRRARTLGLTKAKWSVLAHLARREGVSQNQLAEILEVEPITLARHIDRLAAQMWVERRPDPTDRRVNRLYLTEKAIPILDELHAMAEATREDTLDGLSADQRELLIDMLLAVKENLSAKTNDRAAKKQPSPIDPKPDTMPRTLSDARGR